MRTKSILFEIENISTLIQYLYISEEHTIQFESPCAKFTLRIDDNLDVWGKNMNFPDLPEFLYNDHMSPEGCMDIIWQLKQQPAIEYPEHFPNRWEEIKNITLGNLGLNKTWR